MCIADSLDITPCFVLASAREAITLARWLHDHLPELKEVAAQTTAHGRLVELHTHVFGRRLFARFVFTTGDAMGMNMVNLAVDRVCRHTAEMTGCDRYYLRCNYSSDKKPAAINLFRPYGKEVAVDFTLPAAVAETHLGVSTRELVDFLTAGRQGAMQAGALGMNAHFANGLAAIFIACGQDAPRWSTPASGSSTSSSPARTTSTSSPGSPISSSARSGAGPSLPTQSACLALLDCRGDGTARKFAEIVAATLVAGDLAIAAALANGRFIEAHRQNRERNRPSTARA